MRGWVYLECSLLKRVPIQFDFVFLFFFFVFFWLWAAAPPHPQFRSSDWVEQEEKGERCLTAERKEKERDVWKIVLVPPCFKSFFSFFLVLHGKKTKKESQTKRKKSKLQDSLSLSLPGSLPSRERERKKSAFYPCHYGPQIKQGYPLNLSILISGGKETNKDSLSNGERNGKSPNLKSLAQRQRVVIWRNQVPCSICLAKVCWNAAAPRRSSLGHRGWKSRFASPQTELLCPFFKESDCLGMQSKTGGKFHPRLNISKRPIANKYREGKMKRTLKREFNSTWNCWKGNAWNYCCSARDLFRLQASQQQFKEALKTREECSTCPRASVL